MLERLRDSSRSFGSYLIFGVIILVFVIYFGPGGQSCGDIGNTDTVTWAAKVDGKEIPIRDFRIEYDSLVNRFRQQMGADFDPQQMGVLDTAVDNLVTRRLLIDHAKAQGIAVSDSEIAEVLQEEPAFQKDGHFDFETYREVLRNWQGISPARYEAQLRENLLVGKVLSQIKLAAKVTEDEIVTAFQRQNDFASLEFVRVSPTDLESEALVTDEEVQTYLASEDGKKQVEDEYEAKSWKYKTPQRVSAQHILIKVDEDAPEAEAKAAEAKILAAKKEIEEGSDFGEVAKRVSEDVGTKEKGGDLGTFGPGSMVKPFEDAAMAMKAGEISDPVRSRFGFHLIKVNEVFPASEKSLDEVQEELARELLASEAAKKEAKTKAEAILAEAKGSSLSTLYPRSEGEESKGPQVEETGKFSVASDYVPKLGVASELVRAAVTKDEPGLLDQVFEVSGAFVVAELASREKPDLEALDDEKKKELRERLKLGRQSEMVESFVEALKKDVKVETNEVLITAGF